MEHEEGFIFSIDRFCFPRQYTCTPYIVFLWRGFSLSLTKYQRLTPSDWTEILNTSAMKEL